MSDEEAPTQVRAKKYPEQPKTTELEAPSPEMILLTRLSKSMDRGFATMEDRLDAQDVTSEKQSKKLDTVVADGEKAIERLGRIEDRVHRVEIRVEDLEGRTGKHSLAVRGSSQVNLEQDAQLAQEMAAREELAKEHAATKALVLETKQILEDQSDFMGMGKKGLTWLGSKEGRAAMMQLAATIAAFYAALKAAGVFK